VLSVRGGGCDAGDAVDLAGGRYPRVLDFYLLILYQLHMDIVFVLFGGSFSSKVRWEYAFEGNSTLRKLNFLDELNKLGKTYTFNYKHFNLNYYGTPPDEKSRVMWSKIINKYKYYTPDIDFSIGDLDYKNICASVHDAVQKRHGVRKKYVVIGHSYGGALALLFSKLYSDECILCCCLDNVPYVKSYYKKYDEKEHRHLLDKYTSDSKLKSSLRLVKTTRDQDSRNQVISDLFGFIMYKSAQDRLKYFDGKLYVPTLFFKKRDNQRENKEFNEFNERERKHFERDRKLLGYSVRENVGHYVWENQSYSDLIVKTIKRNIH
jgi:pimeloyl-ACP methyl ester carboxylesterase